MRRRGGRRDGHRPPARARSRAARHGPRAQGPHAVAAQARHLPGRGRGHGAGGAHHVLLEGGHAAAARLVKRGVTGVICASDLLALGTVRAARRAGLAVPADISVIGYDDSALMNCTEPPLTTVRQPIDAMGRAAVDLLVAQIDKAVVPADELLFEPELVVRASTTRARP
ncbi:substrate-binding domain-containing protein [Nonomuraea rubra]|uniref:substrate-binding domain-containing protein n=1 Tax=Nonomuraea rubra TaxID=46180 RepID=UPI0036220850